MKDLFGQALWDFYHQKFEDPLLLYNDYDAPEEVPPDRFFDGMELFDELEDFALEHTQGRILDIGAATGRHALHLQGLGADVTAMDFSALCCEIMKERGVGKIIQEDVFSYSKQKYDTLLMLMNGIGLAGDLQGLHKLLLHLKKIIAPGGQILLDSTDVAYLYENTEIPMDKYYGEISYKYRYKGVMGDEFRWLYVDQQTLTDVAIATGWICQIIFEDETDAYLARLQLV